MAKAIVTIQGPKGEELFFQYDEAEDADGSLKAVTAFEDVAARTKFFAEHLRSTIVGSASLFLQAIREGSEALAQPDKITLEFGLQIGGETGIPLVTKGTAEANMKVTLEWAGPPK